MDGINNPPCARRFNIMKYVEVQPEIITDKILDEINAGVFHIHKYPDGEQVLLVPSNTPVEFFTHAFDIQT